MWWCAPTGLGNDLLSPGINPRGISPSALAIRFNASDTLGKGSYGCRLLGQRNSFNTDGEKAQILSDVGDECIKKVRGGPLNLWKNGEESSHVRLLS